MTHSRASRCVLIFPVYLLLYLSFFISPASAQDYSAVKSVTTKFQQALNLYDSLHPLYQAPSAYDFNQDGRKDTLTDVDNSCDPNNPTACAQQEIRLLLSDPPPDTKPADSTLKDYLSLQSNDRLHRSMQHWILADYLKYKYETASDAQHKQQYQAKMAPHLYLTIFYLDMLSTPPRYATPLSGLKDLNNNHAPCAYANAQSCTFDTRAIIDESKFKTGGHRFESITRGSQLFNQDLSLSTWEWQPQISDLATYPFYSTDPNSPCFGKGPGTCSFDTRTMVEANISGATHQVESITIGAKAYNYDWTTGNWWNLMPDLGAVTNYNNNVNAPCYGRDPGTCRFDTRTMVQANISGTYHTVESITIGAKAYNYDWTTGNWWNLMPDLGAVTNYNNNVNAPCYGREPNTCSFDTRTMVQVDIGGSPHTVESITIGAKAYNYDWTTGNWWNLMPDLGAVYSYHGDSIYTLADTLIAERYLADANGVHNGLIELYHKGLIPQTYCTPLETPYDQGKNCKTINLHNRLLTIFSCLLSRSETHWLYDPDNPGALRTKYYDLMAYLQNPTLYPDINAYTITPNLYTNYSQGVGRLDLAGRSCSALPENVPIIKSSTAGPSRYMYFGHMVSLAMMAQFLKEQSPALYPEADLNKIITFSQNAVAQRMAIKLDNPGTTPGYFNDNFEFINTNVYNQPVRSSADIPSCNGTVVGDWTNPINPPDCVGGTKEILGNEVIGDQAGWQYLGGVLESLHFDWKNSPAGIGELQKNLPFLRQNLLQTYFKDGHSLVILDPKSPKAGYFDANVLSQIMPDKIGTCQQNTSGHYYHRTSTDNSSPGAVNAFTGQEPFLIVSAVAYALFNQMGDVDAANQHLTLTNQLLDTYLVNPPNPNDVINCWSGNFMDTNSSLLNEINRHTAYYRVATHFWEGYLASLTPPPMPTPIPGDTNHDGVVDWRDIFSFLSSFTNIFSYNQILKNFSH